MVRGITIKPYHFFKSLVERVFSLLRRDSDEPTLKRDYFVSDGAENIALLKDPLPEQFWVEFTLAPTTDDPIKQERLYSIDFWLSDDLKITEKGGKQVKFLPAMRIDESEYEVTLIDYFKDRPKRIRLRGPYK